LRLGRITSEPWLTWWRLGGQAFIWSAISGQAKRLVWRSHSKFVERADDLTVKPLALWRIQSEGMLWRIMC
jgi:hypothetical protein